jgi:hypothetical protein
MQVRSNFQKSQASQHLKCDKYTNSLWASCDQCFFDKYSPRTLFF